MTPEEKKSQRRQRTDLERKRKAALKAGFRKIGKQLEEQVRQMRKNLRAAYKAVEAELVALEGAGRRLPPSARKRLGKS